MKTIYNLLFYFQLSNFLVFKTRIKIYKNIFKLQQKMSICNILFVTYQVEMRNIQNKLFYSLYFEAIYIKYKKRVLFIKYKQNIAWHVLCYKITDTSFKFIECICYINIMIDCECQIFDARHSHHDSQTDKSIPGTRITAKYR